MRKALRWLEAGMTREVRVAGVFMAGAALYLLLPDVSHAIVAPSTGDLAYDLYDIGVNKMLKGPVGFVGGVAAVAFGAIQAFRVQILPATAAILGGAALLKADTIVTSLGALF